MIQGAAQPGEPQLMQPAGQQPPHERPPVDPQEKALAADWLKRVREALDRPAIKQAHQQFATNRQRLRGIGPDGKRRRTNLHFANLASIRPQIYAKDPEFSVTPKPSVDPQQLPATKAFAETAEIVLTELLIKDAQLKKRAKRLLTSAFTTAVGWWKVSWQEDKRTDPIIANQLKDTQDNLMRLQGLRDRLADPAAGGDMDLEIEKVKQAVAGLQGQAEITVARGTVIDFVLAEDIIPLDMAVREVGDYLRSSALAHRIWMSREMYRQTFGYEPAKAKSYAESSASALPQVAEQSGKQSNELLCVFEIWEQASNRVFHVCEGDEGFCRAPFTPDWTGRRWYPFFGLAFNEIEGTFYPLSDVELTDDLVEEYNKNRSDFVHDREKCLPLNVVREGGSLTPSDVKNIANRKGGDTIVVKGTPGTPLAQDIFSGSLGQLDANNYDTSPARADIEQIVGGGDAGRGTVMKAKTATEAEILSQGLRSRSSERQDTMEDMLGEVGEYVLEVCLRKLTPEEVTRIAGKGAVWPRLTADEVFQHVSVGVRGGSTGKPDRLQEQDRWTKVMPVLKDTIAQVAELYDAGKVQLAQAVIALTRETLRRFDERIDIDSFLPPPPKDGQEDPGVLRQQLQQAQEQVKQMAAELEKRSDEIEKGYVQAAAQIATSANPAVAAVAFGQVLTAIENRPEPGEDPGMIQPPAAPMVPPPSQGQPQ